VLKRSGNSRFIYQFQTTKPDMLLRASLLVKVAKGGHVGVLSRFSIMHSGSLSCKFAEVVHAFVIAETTGRSHPPLIP
jgi:hypothetical protein